LKLLLLEYTQNFSLGFQTHIADFVQKNRTVVGQFELASLLGTGAGKGPFFMAEQLTFDKLFGYGRTIYGY
jgi:hypothetical protein